MEEVNPSATKPKQASPTMMKLGWYIWRLKWNFRYRKRRQQIADTSRQTAEVIRASSYQEDEAVTMPEFIESLETTYSGLRGWNEYNLMTPRFYSILYSLVRKLKPALAVETGVMFGSSSYAILSAMETTGTLGRLISIDISSRPFGYPVGFAVPEALRRRWQLVVADSKLYLPSALDELKSIDLFLSDGDHSYEAMLFEMELAWAHLRGGGLLIVDDCHLNLALSDFSREQSVVPFLLSRDGMNPESMAILIR
jgi:predicted O-methyltransferase YrrM